MIRKYASIIFALGLLMGTATSYAAEYLVKYKNQTGLKQLTNLPFNLRASVQVLEQNEKGKYVLVDVNEGNLLTTLANLAANPNVEWVVENFKIKAFAQPADIFELREQWSIAKVQGEKAWTRAESKGLKSIIIAVIDTGVDYRHPNLAPNMLPGYDFKGNDNDPMDETSAQNPGHGTHCAGIAAATGLIDNGIVGMAPNVAIMPIRFLGADGSGDLNAAIRSVDYAIEKGAHVISASWGATVARSTAQPLIEAVERADAAGVIFVAAAANDGANNDSTDVFPANSGTPNMISVAASSADDSKPSWSNYGKATVHIASPGDKIMSTIPNNQYKEFSGTSMATPMVSGLVAFLKSQDSSLTGAQIRALLQTTGAKVNIETACNCRIDAFEAVDHLLNKEMWLVPAATSVAEGASFIVNVMNGEKPFEFTSSNPAVLTVDNTGAVAAVAKGTAQITVKDANGTTVSSLDYNVGMVAEQPPGGACPIGDPALCQVLCGIFPELPFCQ